MSWGTFFSRPWRWIAMSVDRKTSDRTRRPTYVAERAHEMQTGCESSTHLLAFQPAGIDLYLA